MPSPCPSPRPPSGAAASGADRPSLLESLAARLKAATAKLPPGSANTNNATATAAAESAPSERTSPLLISDLIACC